MKRKKYVYIFIIINMLLSYPKFGIVSVISVANVPVESIKIDGDLGDWSGITAHSVDKKEHAVFRSQNWQNSNDLSFSYNIASDGKCIFLSIQVTDDKLVIANHTAQLLKSDHVELWFDPLNLAEKIDLSDSDIDKIETQKFISAHLVQIAISPSGIFQYYIPEGVTVTSPVNVACQQNENAYTIECCLIPQALLNISAVGLQNFGCLIDVVDADDPNKPAQDLIFSSSPQRKFADPGTFFHYQLVSPIFVQSLNHLIERPYLNAVMTSTYPDGYWHFENNQWRYAVMQTDPVWSEEQMKWTYSEYYPEFVDFVNLKSDSSLAVVVSGFEQQIGLALVKDKKNVVAVTQRSGFLMTEKTLTDFDLIINFTEELGIHFSSLNQTDYMLTLSCIDYPKIGLGVCGAAESYVTTFYHITDNNLATVNEIESFPCMENSYRQWKWLEKGKKLQLIESPDPISLRVTISDPENMTIHEISWNGKSFE